MDGVAARQLMTGRTVIRARDCTTHGGKKEMLIGWCDLAFPPSSLSQVALFHMFYEQRDDAIPGERTRAQTNNIQSHMPLVITSIS